MGWQVGRNPAAGKGSWKNWKAREMDKEGGKIVRGEDGFEQHSELLPGKKLGIGLYSLAGVYGEKDLGEVERMLNEAVAKGIDFFDVADSYGPAEEVLGRVLKDCRKQVAIATKVGLKEGGGLDSSYQHLMNSCRRSLDRLQTDYIDLYQIHFADPVTPVEETIRALEDLRGEGLIRHYGLGHLPEDVLREFCDKGNPLTLLLELHPAAISAYLRAQPLCERFGLQILTHGSTGRGIFTSMLAGGWKLDSSDIRNLDPLFHGAMFRSALRIRKRLRELAEKYQKTVVQVALAWSMTCPNISRVLVGPSTREHLREDLGALDLKLNQEDTAELTAFLEDEAVARELERQEEARTILKQELARDSALACQELIYAIDALIDEDREREEALFPYFHKLFELRRQKDVEKKVLEDLQSEIRSYL
ncbi:MAG: aldo/keto reductase [Halanaerobium sp.]|nr:aldo/keto reductase [Halanaerobium sp.]